MSDFVFPLAAIAQVLSDFSLAVQLLGMEHEDSDHTAVHRRLHAEPNRAGEVLSAVMISCLPFA